MLNLNSVLIGSSQPKVLADFYEKILGRKPDMHEEKWWGWSVGSSFFSIGSHSKVKGKSKDPSRILLNFETKEVEKEYKRMVKLGAVSVKKPYMIDNMWIATLADSDGNYFQLMTPWEE